MMINEKLAEILKDPTDGAIAIVTQGTEEPHIANTWNSYIEVTEDDRLLIPAAGMKVTEKNIAANHKVWLTIANREVQGKMYKGTGVAIKGTARFLTEGKEFDGVKEKFVWLRAVLEVTVETAEQTL